MYRVDRLCQHFHHVIRQRDLPTRTQLVAAQRCFDFKIFLNAVLVRIGVEKLLEFRDLCHWFDDCPPHLTLLLPADLCGDWS